MMDGSRFDNLARSLAGTKSRRGFLGSLLGLGAGLIGATASAACPPGQLAKRGICVCKQTGRPPANDACPCPKGLGDTGDGLGCLECRSVADCPAGDACRSYHCAGGSCTISRTDCSALDDACNVGVCRASAGGCVALPRDDGTPCDDGNACTQADTCQAGVCRGANPIICTALSQCHDAGVCNPATGRCFNPPSANTRPCNDGNLCTQTDRCDGAGSCVGGNPVICTASDPCHLAGVCNPSTGRCSDPPAPAGTPCGSATTCADGVQHARDACDGGGICVAGATQTCDPYFCGASACLTSCAQDADCVGAAHCDGGACVGDRVAGDACDEPSDCQSGFCNVASDICCTQDCAAGVACSGAGFTCDTPTCGAETQPCCSGGSCNAELTCVAGTCQTPPACHSSGEPCPNGVADCCAGFICSGGECVLTCQPADQPCPGGNQDCCGGLTCVGGICHTPPSCVASLFPCQLGPCCSDFCLDNRCADNSSCQQFGQSCDAGDPCCSAFICSAGTCLVRPPCRAAGDACPNGARDCCTGLACTGGLCTFICQEEGASCPNGDEDCCGDLTCSGAGFCQAQCAPPGQRCDSIDCCIGGLCVDGRCLDTEGGCKRGGEACGGAAGECCVSDGGIPLACVEGICRLGCFPAGTACHFGDICCSGRCVGEIGQLGQCG